MEVIHLVLGKANPDRLNGVNKVVNNMATEQVKAGKNVKVWGVAADTTHDYPDRNYETIIFKAERSAFRVDAELKKAIVKHKTAVFHLHGGWVPLFYRLAKIFIQHEIKYVITPHGAYNTIAMQRSYWKKKAYFHLFEKTLLTHAHKVHAIGSSEVSGLSTLIADHKSFLLPYGFDIDTTTASDKNDTFTIGFVGRLDTHTKGLDLLLEAFANFQKTHTYSTLWIIGGGEGKEFLEAYIKKNALQNVVLWGKKFGAEKDALVSKMHVFAHPSRNEGLPTAVLEAASLGVPTIVSKATNVAEYVRTYNAGIAIADNNSKALEVAMDQLYQTYQSNDERKYVTGAKQMLLEVFSWPVLVERYDKLYA